jgi:hypothetical protein
VLLSTRCGSQVIYSWVGALVSVIVRLVALALGGPSLAECAALRSRLAVAWPVLPLRQAADRVAAVSEGSDW